MWRIVVILLKSEVDRYFWDLALVIFNAWMVYPMATYVFETGLSGLFGLDFAMEMCSLGWN